MTAGSDGEGIDERVSPGEVDASASRPGRRDRSTTRVLTDGGRAAAERADETESDDGASENETREELRSDEETEADEETEGKAETEAKEGERGGGDESEGDGEREDGDESEEDGERGGGDESEEDGEREGGDESEGDGEREDGDESEEDGEREDGDESEEDGEREDGDESEEDGEYHVEDADDVYESDETAGVLHLDLDGLFLDLLGLEVNLDAVTLDVSARPGENNLLGNLLSAVSGLLDGPRAVLDTVTSLLGKPKEWVIGLIDRLKDGAMTVLTAPKRVVGRLFGRGGSPAKRGKAETEDMDEKAAGADGGLFSRAGGWLRGSLSSATEWVKDRLAGFVPNLPIEAIVATVVRETLQALIDQLESGIEESETDEEPAETEAEL
ncbi:hypothetical protein [Natronobacterium gregoryi]|uniref:Uncharacterized protein n=1 Tax=Natronobacterium gregoryi (strain ATCC 43098 / DSM 3393 / CCM 3738 / CIP 104747 / IAM 13177 / JCM 8860 / NBRC 102187 / NCIMB 2189 / SP2) TaxID=797304 RepID=A0A2J4JGJ4_NATGS|nr:hypothetical protein [Natronobacterium gregoryi]PLK21031.1 hypothetical protein CYV19_06255 [Natronobacterium gregoryi SP2]